MRLTAPVPTWRSISSTAHRRPARDTARQYNGKAATKAEGTLNQRSGARIQP